MSKFATFVAFLCVAATSVGASSCNYTLSPGQNWIEVQAALDVATDPGEFVVCVECGGYLGCGDDPVVLQSGGGGPVVVRGSYDCGGTAPLIDCQGVGKIGTVSGNTSVLSIENLRFTNATTDPSDSGAILSVEYGAHASLRSVEITHCNGGAVVVQDEGSVLDVSSCSFSSNNVINVDGLGVGDFTPYAFGIVAVEATCTVVDTEFAFGMMEHDIYGGAIFSYQSSLSVTSSQFYQNVGYYGTTICAGGGQVSLHNSSLVENYSAPIANVYVLTGTLDVSDCWLEGNGGKDYGNTFFVRYLAHFSLTRSTFLDNYSSHFGACTVWYTPFNETDCGYRGNSCYLGASHHFLGSNFNIYRTRFDEEAAELASISVQGSVGSIVRSTFSDGTSASVHCNSGSLIVVDGSSFQRNACFTGCGVGLDASQAVITNSSFIENTAGSGGAVHGGVGSQLNMSDCSLEANAAVAQGGAIAVASESALFMRSCVIDANSADSGGAISMTDKSTAEVSLTTMTGNSGSSRGGTVEVVGSTCTLRSVEVSGGSATSGGGVFCGEGALLSLSGSAVSACQADYSGGGVAVQGGDLIAVNSEFTANYARLIGGAFYVSGNLSAESCVVADNTAPLSGSTLFFIGDGECTLANTVVSDGWGDTPIVATTTPVNVVDSTLSCNGVASEAGVVADNAVFSGETVLENNYVFDDSVYELTYAAHPETWVRGSNDGDPRTCARGLSRCDAFTCYNNATCADPTDFADVATCDCGTADPGPGGAKYAGKLCNEICGNGVVEGDEACDDGNTNGDDGCSSDCYTVATGFLCDAGAKCTTKCGDGDVAEGVEECDDVGDSKCVDCKRVGSRVLSTLESLLTAAVPLALFAIVACVCHYLNRKYPGTRHMDILWMLVALLDVSTDVAFAAEVYADGYGRSALHTQLFHVCVAVLCLGVVVNGIAVVYFVLKEAHGPQGHEFKGWMFNNSTAVAILFFLSTTNLGVIRSMDSKILNLGMFSAPLSHGARAKAHAIGIVSNLIEDGPQVVIQTYYLFGTDSGEPTVALVLSLCVTLFVLLSSSMSRIIKLLFVGHGAGASSGDSSSSSNSTETDVSSHKGGYKDLYSESESGQHQVVYEPSSSFASIELEVDEILTSSEGSSV